MDPLTQMLYIDTRASLPDDLLMVGDKMSMANSLEARVPFLDYRLIEFVEGLPPHLKLNGLTKKYLHKKALEKWLPEEVVYRKKKGFANPIENWFRDRMRPFVEDCLLSPRFGRRALFRSRVHPTDARAGSRGARAAPPAHCTCWYRSSSGIADSSNRSDPMDLSVIIVNWNSRVFLKRCIASIIANVRTVHYEIVVIDSGSFDGCEEMLP